MRGTADFRQVLFLASTSPRRRELLSRAGMEFELHPPGPEPTGEGAPVERAVQRARAKALHAPPLPRPGLVLGVDTLVVCAGVEFGKPADRDTARAMLVGLRDREHEVVTAHCVADPASGRCVEATEISVVRCASLGADEIEAYLDGGDWTDKAGGYGIQSDAAAFMTLVRGHLDTVIGLHVPAVRRLVAAL